MTFLSWILDPPQETLRPDFLESLPRCVLGFCFSSALFSYAIGETLVVQPHDPVSLSPVGPTLLASICFIFFAFYALFGFIFSVVQWSRNESTDWSSAVSVGMASMIPLHLVLPLALLCWPLGPGGLVLYSIVKLSLWLVVVRRLAAGFQNLYGWPAWRGMLVALSPVMLACVGFIVLSGLMMVVAAVSLLSLLS